MNIERLGWIAAACMAGAFVGMGFRAPGDKTGTVDVTKVFHDSDLSKSQNEVLQAEVQERRDVVQFVQANREMKSEDADRLRLLSTKDKPTPADKTEIEKIKLDAQADSKKARDLQVKDKPTSDELAQIEMYTKRKDTNTQRLQQWNGEFQQELQDKQQNLNSDALTKVRQAIQQVARDQGYSIVFAQDIAPYCANDLTSDAAKAMSKK